MSSYITARALQQPVDIYRSVTHQDVESIYSITNKINTLEHDVDIYYSETHQDLESIYCIKDKVNTLEQNVRLKEPIRLPRTMKELLAIKRKDLWLGINITVAEYMFTGS